MKKPRNVVAMVYCQFCGMSNRASETDFFIVGPTDRVCICSACVEICNDIIREQRSEQSTEEPPSRSVAIDPAEGRVADGPRAPESSDLSAALPPPVPGADQ